MEPLVVLVKKHKLEKFILKWSGAFRYLNSSNNNGFTKQNWSKLNQPIDDGIVDTMFRILKQEKFLNELTPGYFYIENEYFFQRVFEVVNEIVNFDFETLNNKQSHLLWTVSPQASNLIPNNITRHFGYLFTYMINEIASAQNRIVFLAPYFSESGIKQLIQSINAVLSVRSNIVIDFIVSDIESTMNKAALKYLMKNVVMKKGKSNCIRIFEPLYKENNSLWFHAKLLLIDDEKGYLGSANFSERALNSQFELGVILEKEQIMPLIDLIDFWIKDNTFVLRDID